MEKKFKIIFLVLIVIVFTFIIRFLYNEYQDQRAPIISFDKYRHSFDTIIKPKGGEVYFTYKNIGTKDLIIKDIQTTCGCTIPVWNQNFLAYGKKDSLMIKYHTENKGHFVKEIMVYSNSANSPTRLKINGYVPFSFE